jgi:hypothetical protein
MKKRKPFYQIGDLVQIRDIGSNTSWKMLNKMALVLKVYPEGHEDFIRYYGNKPIYDVHVFDASPDDGFSNPSGWGSSKFLDERCDRLRIRQSDLRKFKKLVKCRECGQKFKNQTTWACLCESCNDEADVDRI